MARFSLRNQDKIKKSLGDDFHKWLMISIKKHFEEHEVIQPIAEYPKSEPFPIIHIENAQPKTDSCFELYITSQNFDVYNLAYKSCMS